MSEMCCMLLAGNTRRKSDAKNHYLHHSATLSGYIFTTKACIDNPKKLVIQQYLHNMVNFSPLTAEIGW